MKIFPFSLELAPVVSNVLRRTDRPPLDAYKCVCFPFVVLSCCSFFFFYSSSTSFTALLKCVRLAEREREREREGKEKAQKKRNKQQRGNKWKPVDCFDRTTAVE